MCYFMQLFMYGHYTVSDIGFNFFKWHNISCLQIWQFSFLLFCMISCNMKFILFECWTQIRSLVCGRFFFINKNLILLILFYIWCSTNVMENFYILYAIYRGFILSLIHEKLNIIYFILYIFIFWFYLIL